MFVQHFLTLRFQLLGAKIAVMKPEDPNAFLVAELKKIQITKAKGQPVFTIKTIIISHFKIYVCGTGVSLH